MLALPWVVTPRDMTAGDVITLGRTPAGRDITLTLAADVQAGALLGVGPDGRLHPWTPDPKPRPNPRPAKRRTPCSP